MVSGTRADSTDFPSTPLTPEQIALRRFTVRTRGYDTAEVDAYLRAVASDYRDRLASTEAEMEALREAAGTTAPEPRPSGSSSAPPDAIST